MRATTHGSLIVIVLIARTRLMTTLLVFEQEPAQINRNVLQMVVCSLYAHQSVYVSRLVCDLVYVFMRALPKEALNTH